MAAVIQLLGWEASGLRCPDHKVSFEGASGSVVPISLLQMPNGTGKTTTLELLRATLSGSARDWPALRIREQAKRGNEAGRGTFQVSLLHNSSRVTVSLTMDFDQGTCRYSTTSGSGNRDGHHPPPAIAKFLSPSFVRFFVFDGELAEQLLRREDTNAELAVAHLFQLDLFRALSDRIEAHWQQQTKTATEDRGLARRQNRVTALTKHLATLKSARAKLQGQLSQVEDLLAATERRFADRLAEQEDLRRRVQEAQLALKDARAQVQLLAASVLAAMRDPHALAGSLAREVVDFRESLDRVKLPESTAREFFEELACEEVCVCNRPLDDVTRRAIRERAEVYLGSEEVGLLNSLKNAVTELVGDDPAAHEVALDALLEQLAERRNNESERQTELDAVIQEGVDNDPALEEARKAIESLTSQCNEMRRGLQRFEDTTESDDSTGIKVIERRLKDAENKLAEITNTLDLKSKRDSLQAILRKAETTAKQAIGRDVCDQANQRIAQLMPYNRIRIEKIDRCLVLQGQEGASVGETLSVAYAFLATLFDRTEHQLPFVVDSPANPIDLAVRQKVAELIPKLTRQFVAFTISSEREGFVAPLEQASPAPIQFLTLFRKGATALEQAAAGEAGLRETADGLLVGGREFFQSFHVETEA